MAKVALDTRADAALPPAPGYADAVDVGRATIEATRRSNAALKAGPEATSQEIAQYARTAFAGTGETARSLLSARTLADVVRPRADFATRSFACFVALSAKLSEFCCSLVDASVGAWSVRAKS